jgi:Glycosyl hydrolase family 26
MRAKRLLWVLLALLVQGAGMLAVAPTTGLGHSPVPASPTTSHETTATTAVAPTRFVPPPGKIYFGVSTGGVAPTTGLGHSPVPASPTTSHETLATTAVAPTRFVPPPGKIYFGVSTGGVGANYDAFLRGAGVPAVAIYNRWTTPNGNFDWLLRESQRRPTTVMISWNFPGDGRQASIANGVYDDYIRQRIVEIKGYGKPVFIRLNWEFNGFWYRWSAQDSAGKTRPGNSPEDYKAAWRHVVSMFAGLRNVTFVWCPNLFEPVPVAHGLTVYDWYPGDAYVGWVGLDAYPGSASWGWMQNGKQGMNELYAFARRRHKPMMIAEWGLNTVSTGDSPAWMRWYLDWIARHPGVKAALYFDYNNMDSEGKDYRLSTFPGAAQFLRSNLQNGRWQFALG